MQWHKDYLNLFWNNRAKTKTKMPLFSLKLNIKEL